MKNAAELRAEIIQGNNLLRGHPLRLIVCDDHSSPEKAAKIAEKLVTRAGVSAIIGTCSQTISSVVTPVGNVCQVPTIITSGFDVDYYKDRYIFNTSHQAEIMIEHSFEYLKNNLGISSVGLLMPINLLGELGSALAIKLGKKHGIRVVCHENFNPDSPSITKHVAMLRASGPQAVFAYVTGEPAARVAKAMACLHMTVPLLISHGNANTFFLKSVDHLPITILVPAGQTMSPEQMSRDNPCRRVIVKFNETHMQKYDQPVDYCSAASSDAIGLVSEGFRVSESFYGPDLREAIEKIGQFEGMEGVYSFSSNNHYGRELGQLVMLRLKDGCWQGDKMDQARAMAFGLRLSRAVQVMDRLNNQLPSYRLAPVPLDEAPLTAKALGSDSNHCFTLYQDLKHRLMGALRLRDGKKTRELLSRITSLLLCIHLDNLEIFRVWVTELFMTLYQAVSHDHAESEKLDDFKLQTLSEIGTAPNPQNLCLRYLTAVETLLDNLENHNRNRVDSVLLKAMGFIDENCHTPLPIDRIARAVCLSPSRLSHLMKERYNLTLGGCIALARIDKSKQMLRYTDMPISLIAQEVGYPDQSYFTKVFKKIEKRTPARFRRE
jgi:branched-chain amino acid transport system substrate-binding protein